MNVRHRPRACGFVAFSVVLVSAASGWARPYEAGKFQGRPVTEEGESDVKRRFSAKGVRSLRRRLKVSQAEFAKLLGVSAQAVYLWEGKSGPLALRQETRKALANLRGLGRREIKKMLEGTPAAPKGKPGPKPKGKKGRKRGRKPRAKK